MEIPLFYKDCKSGSDSILSTAMNEETKSDVGDLLERSSRLLNSIFHADGMPPAQWQALRYLDRANRFSRSPGSVGLYLDATKGTVSQTLNALERKGFVAKHRGGTDRRSVSLELTESGRALLNADPRSRLDETLASLPPSHREKLAQGLEALIGALIAANGGRPFGLCGTCRHFERLAHNGNPHRCALLGVALSEEDGTKICVEHEAA